jgi:hypothetical protein
LETLPRNVRFLDLSMNFISSIPQTANWSQLKGINLSENSFSEWPLAIVPEAIPKLAYLSLAVNTIGDPPPSQIGFRHLRMLDLSYTRITMVPSWIGECARLRVLKLAGDSDVRRFPPEILAIFKGLLMADLSGIDLGIDQATMLTPPTICLVVMKGFQEESRPKGNLTCIL